MGSASKVVLVGAASLIVGVYGISLKMVQGTDVGTALSQVRIVQNERTDDAALRAALDRITRSPYLGKYSLTGSLTALGGGTMNYNYTSYTSWGNMTLTMNQDGDSRIIDVTLEKKTTTNPGFRHILRGQWQVTKYHVRSLH
jgi:hypothetical protein